MNPIIYYISPGGKRKFWKNARCCGGGGNIKAGIVEFRKKC
jgi:hypothetical protein